MTNTTEIHVIGAGLAGSEATWQIANQGLKVTLHEMRPNKLTDAHHTGNFAEMVCSNSFRSDDSDYNAVGLIHYEMRKCNSIIMACADENKVPAGSALAVDRDGFAQSVTARLKDHPNVTIEYGEISSIDEFGDKPVIIATGPLTSENLAKSILTQSGEEELSFFDAIAPIVYKESINFEKAWYQSRYDKVGPDGDGADYINLPLEKDEYYAFINALLEGEKADIKQWEGTPYFEGCLPVEVMAERGVDTLRFGPLKPVGLINPHTGTRPYAVVQLRQDNKIGTLYNMVGFQTKLKHGAQTEIFKMIPGLENAQFARLGGIHRNTFLNSPKILDEELRMKSKPNLRFAGQITGCEGYVESAAIGLLAGRFTAAQVLDKKLSAPPITTALGAILNHVTNGHVEGKKGTFQPMNVNFGLFPELDQEAMNEVKKVKGKERDKAKKLEVTKRAKRDLESWG
ncbi:methylenetetrahydrofolate--tRNA-(uracil(54)-C(5))-methyltransferase (FADH(2)-oxidizing) TrmFO [Pseudaquidulcibacter saccharophilus]|uniref:methylenetetrahydrofolate--tRNA-(uracil(54)- C(5))-methyltransferase (FADH(2)-oxidizing) TrmFO n=1 Tax=Pseudaquidulcibacter saccharophilus TaxID=2831900 RepID=UPI001EFF2691|nr:methylenetetrahydrofolate--tRNA-(uracil(54)-C(5))-methyltransferase (FADH(2)-oxidizing) TrmFO [Pseudaquidulcibacter saccharophilus]